MLDLNIMHIIESSLGLTIGGLLLKAVDRACKSGCSRPDVQNISEPKEESDLADNVSEMTDFPDYYKNNIDNIYNGGYHQKEQ
jgi:hypothetical protein